VIFQVSCANMPLLFAETEVDRVGDVHGAHTAAEEARVRESDCARRTDSGLARRKSGLIAAEVINGGVGIEPADVPSRRISAPALMVWCS